MNIHRPAASARWPIARAIHSTGFEPVLPGRRRFRTGGALSVEKVILEQYNKRRQIILDSTPQDVEVDIEMDGVKHVL
ncbi:MAG: hypothetical protein M9936_15635 [Caldilinea sp.]|nr:hypothetical protein [Caldilinea sp.]MCB0052981.1 hypothetical protein [Caldilinea sp.]MCB9116048.1 hypothetical protein [Caldilineaceae bacterium]MCO5211124.1 hypothetical protein [Caldilinea sp.]